MPGITHRKDGRYEIRKMINGKRKSFYTKTLTEAKKILRRLKKSGDFQEEEKKYDNITLLEWTNEWKETYKKPFISPVTYKMLKNTVNNITKELGYIKLASLKSITIQNYLNNLPKNRTKERIELYFNALLQKAVDVNILDKNPFNAIQKTKKSKSKHHCFTFAEQETILKAIKGTRIEYEIMIYLMCGCRPKEIPSKQNFDFNNNIITVNGTKTEKSKERKIEMTENFANYIKVYFEKHDIVSYYTIRTIFKEICEKNGIAKPLIYRLRHTFASNHFVLGTPAKQVAEWLGHTSILMTLDTYTDIDKSATKQKIQTLYNNYYIEKNF